MTKNHFLLVIVLTMAITINAQSTKIKSERLLNHKTVIDGLMQPQLSESKPLKMALTERVIAQSTYDNGFSTKNDSVKLNYVLNGTSTYDFNMMLYPYNYPYSTSPMFNYLGVFTKPQVEYSAYSHWTVNPNTLVYGFYQKDMVGYDINRNLINDTALYADSAIYPNMTYINKYNSFNDIDTSLSFVYAGGISTNAFKQFFSYNTSNKLIKDSIYEYDAGSWHLVSKTFYTYNVANDLIQIDNYSNNTDTTFTLPLIEQLKYVNTYDASHRLKTVHTSYFDGTSLSPYVIDTFAYSGSHPFHLSWKEYQYDAINSYWAPMTYMTKTLNAAGFPDVININSFDSLANAWVPSIKQLAYYNSNNNPTKLDEYYYNFTAFPSTPDFTTYYYYESFSNTTGIGSTNEASTVMVYPNPTLNNLCISGINNTSKLNLKIIDATGRLMLQNNYVPNNGQINISIENLSQGIYFLMIEDPKGDFFYKQSILKVDF